MFRCQDISKSNSKSTNTHPLPNHSTPRIRTPPRHYGAAVQEPEPDDDAPFATDNETKNIQQVVGAILYYARAVNMTALVSLYTIASEQAQATKTTVQTVKQLLDYLAMHPDATVKFVASDMILNIHSNASYLSAKNACSRAAGIFFMVWQPKDDEPICLNGTFHVLSTILKLVAASTVESELGALFLNMKEGRIF